MNVAVETPLQPLGVVNRKRKVKFEGLNEPNLRRQNTYRLLQDKKLILVLDLDNTLLHSVDSDTLTVEEKFMLQLEETNPNRTMFEWDGAVTKLRPYVRTFLKEASNMYDLYVYTMGCREYALQMVKFLDPEGVYFESKVISREDCTEPGRKGLDVVLGEERVVVVLDDNKFVWERHPMNLLSIDGYCFFGSRHGSLFDSWVDERKYDRALRSKLSVLERVHQLFFSSWVYDDLWERDVRQLLWMCN